VVTHQNPFRRFLGSLVQWIDSDYSVERPEVVRARPDGVNLIRCIPFVILHLGCLGVIWTGTSWFAVGLAAALYFVRMFAVTGIYHRYFSHKSYSTSRFGQFLLALLGATCVQRGALWWAYHHRHHHQHSDEPADAHSPHIHGFWWSHIGWITSRRNFPTDYSRIRDLAKFPELVFLNRFDVLVPVLFATGLFCLGGFLERAAPALHTSASQLLIWGFFISTTALFHGTSCINSLAHLMGARRFETDDDSRNSFILSLITLGEGWHNNHHRYMSATRQGFYWWEIDITYYVLKCLSWTGFIWDLKAVPASIYREAEQRNHHDTVARFSMSSVQDEINAFKRVVPTAAAIAIATVNSPALAASLAQAESHPIHQDVSELIVEPSSRPTAPEAGA
jgi:stearoyl-CoA desaturase (Delta-9 desaturase)